MTPCISDNWPDVAASLEIMEPEYAHRITSLVDQLKLCHDTISAYASSLHPQCLPCQLIPDKYTWGQSFTVFEILFSDNSSWIIRFGMRPMDAYFNTAAQLERKILNEVAALHLVRQRTTIPVPEIIAYHAHPSPSNPLGSDFPAFVLMTAITGMTIEDCGIAIHELGTNPIVNAQPDPLGGDESKRPILQRYLHDIADIHVQLSRITFDRIGSFVIDHEGVVSVGPGADFGLGPFASAKEYFAIQAEAYEKLAIAASVGDENESESGAADAAQLKRRFVASLWRTAMMPLVDERDDRGPFPMRHGDLHSENILVDSTGHIVGVLDWDCAGTVPWEAFAVPTFEVSGHFTEHIDDSSNLPSGYHNNCNNKSTSNSDLEIQLLPSSSVSTSTPIDSIPIPRQDRPTVHHAFNRELALAEKEFINKPASGRTLAFLHDSDAGHVGAYLAYWMYSLACDYEQTGRALHRIVERDGDIDQAFQRFVREVGGSTTTGVNP
ncbi:hypothetical protein BYT27DRAFT_7205264 [Phlegmacium glaucopus]|nr:hypothetical protein BYT27DRAFT_7205264 [Phlegmacium glaucopus]